MTARMPREARRVRLLDTPEGVPLPLELADAGQRLAAFLIDLTILGLLFGMLTLSLFLIGLAIGQRIAARGAIVLWLIGIFVLRNFYFTGFESRPRGATPGKRMMRLRVVARHGGRLTLDAVIARNAMREVEYFLPLSFLAQAGASGLGGWTAAAGLGWSGLFLALPLLNRDRLRAGDLLAGTWVIRTPRRPLLPELVETGDAILFSDTELDAYGVQELETLEQVIRQAHPPAVSTVVHAICHRIGREHWSDDGGERDIAFLRAYYAGLRARLEQKLLFGQRRADKHDRG